MVETFVALRFFIVPVEGHLFTADLTDDAKLELFLRRVFVNQDFHDHRGNLFAMRMVEASHGVLRGKLSRRNQVELRSKEPSDIVSRVEEDWPFMEFYVETQVGRQLAYFEMDSRVARSAEHLSRMLTEHASNLMFDQGYQVSILPIVDETDFWREVERAAGVISVKFVLQSPNLFGATKSANQALADLRKRFNQTRVEITLANPKGNLQLPHDEIDSFRDYADDGGGFWELTFFGKGKGKRRRIRKVKSRDRAKHAKIDFPEDATFMERLNLIRRALLGRADQP